MAKSQCNQLDYLLTMIIRQRRLAHDESCKEIKIQPLDQFARIKMGAQYSIAMNHDFFFLTPANLHLKTNDKLCRQMMDFQAYSDCGSFVSISRNRCDSYLGKLFGTPKMT